MTKNLLLLIGLISAGIVAGQSIPILNGDPSITSRVIYLDFDGQVVSGTAWNNGNTVNALASNCSSVQILQIWRRVCEDFRPFEVNVTTDSARFNNAPATRRIRVIFTPTYSWYGNGAGGVAYVGSFSWGGTPGTPCWIFESQLGYNTKNISEAASHEVGHTLSLRHQSQYNTSCTKINEYHPGQGSGMTSWAPIMGVGYSRNVTIWHSGQSALGCNVIQNDHSTSGITGINFLSFRQDDVGDTYNNAKMLNLATNVTLDSGLITQPGDIDAFRFTICDNRYVTINAKPWALDTTNYSGANLDIRLFLYDAANNVLDVDTPLNHLRGLAGMMLGPGSYFFTIDGGRSNNYTDYGSLGKYFVTVKASNPPAVSAILTTATSTCGGAPLTLAAQPTGTVSSWHWSVNGPTTFTSSAATPTALFASGVHTLTLLVQNSTYTGCPITTTLNIVPMPTVSITGNTLICPGQGVNLSAQGAQSYTWMPGGSTGSILPVSASTPLSYTLTGANSVCQATAAITVSLNPSFTITLAASKTLVCQGESVLLTASGGSSYTLSPGSMQGNTVFVTPGVSANYYVTGKNGACEQTAMVAIIVIPDFTLNVSPSTAVACFGDQVTLTASGANSYTFEPGGITSNPAGYTASVSTVYTVTASNHTLCASQTATTYVQVLMCGVGIASTGQVAADVFPNPAMDGFTVEADAMRSVEVMSPTGALIYSAGGMSGRHQVRCEGWARGIYLLRVHTARGTALRRLVVE